MLPRDGILEIEPDYHGALDYAELAQWGYAPEDVLDFSVNSNPFGTHRAVRDAIANAAVDRYPDKECLALRGKLGVQLGVSVENITVANGTAETIWQIAFAYLRPDDVVLIVAPTFGEYARMSKLMRATVKHISAAELPAALANAPRLVFLCNPNNPTGSITSLTTIHQWMDAAPDTLFVIDEAYINFSTAVSAIAYPPERRANVIILRSMTKDYALAGVRLGYAVAPKSIIDALRIVRVPWNVSEVAQQAGLAALAVHADYVQQWHELRHLAEQFKRDLAQLGYRPTPSFMHYFLVNVGNGSLFREQLLQHGIIVRKCDSFGLPEYVRIATRPAPENARLLKALQKIKTNL